jgi:hypothetical protein
MEIRLLIQKGLDENYEAIEEKSLLLTPVEKLSLYDACKKSAGIPLALNIITGLGIGSFIQGDTIGGAIQLSAMAAGAASLFLAFVPGPHVEIALITSITSSALSGLCGCVAPFVFKHAYNRRLKTALRYDNSVTYQIMPSIDENGNAGVSSIVSFKF